MAFPRLDIDDMNSMDFSRTLERDNNLFHMLLKLVKFCDGQSGRHSTYKSWEKGRFRSVLSKDKRSGRNTMGTRCRELNSIIKDRVVTVLDCLVPREEHQQGLMFMQDVIAEMASASIQDDNNLHSDDKHAVTVKIKCQISDTLTQVVQTMKRGNERRPLLSILRESKCS